MGQIIETSGQETVGSEQQTRKTLSAMRRAPGGRKNSRQQAGGSWQRAADAKRKAPGAERSAFPETGSGQQAAGSERKTLRAMRRAPNG